MRTKRGTVAAMGLQQFLDDKYLYRGRIYIGGYETFTKSLGMTNAQIATLFKVSEATAWSWRKQYHLERGSDL